ncbi:hypothetical protein [Acidocella sp.]|nr:hypothetical protein [Acidocella sp.]
MPPLNTLYGLGAGVRPREGSRIGHENHTIIRGHDQQAKNLPAG